jgi:hypothetical protein
VGLVFPITPGDLGDALFLTVAAALNEGLAEAGLDLLIVSTTAGDEVATYRRAIRGRRIGAFVVPRTRVRDARIELLHGGAGGLVQSSFKSNNIVTQEPREYNYQNHAARRAVISNAGKFSLGSLMKRGPALSFYYFIFAFQRLKYVFNLFGLYLFLYSHAWCHSGKFSLLLDFFNSWSASR